MTNIGDDSVGGERSVHATITLTAGPDAPASARGFVHRRLEGREVSDDVLADLLVVVSELVSNAVEHGTGDPRLALSLDGGRIRIEVGDEAVSAPPTPRPHDNAAYRGRGLLIVATVADRWGHVRRGDVKWIWAELDAATVRALTPTPVA